MIGEQLQGNDSENGVKKIESARYVDNMIRDIDYIIVPLVRDRDDLALSRFDLVQVSYDLLVGPCFISAAGYPSAWT